MLGPDEVASALELGLGKVASSIDLLAVIVMLASALQLCR